MTFTTNCPACGEGLDVEEQHRDWTVRCPKCRHEFTATSDTPRPVREPRPRADFDPRRRRSRRSDPDEPDFEAAREKLAQPGQFLEAVGWLSTLLSIGLAVLLILLGADGQKQPGQAGEDAVVLIVLGGCLGVFGVPYSLAMAIGGRKMRSMSSRRWAMTACVLGIAAIVMFGLLGLLHIAAGIWGLTALMDQNVEACFRAQQERATEELEASFDD